MKFSSEPPETRWVRVDDRTHDRTIGIFFKKNAIFGIIFIKKQIGQICSIFVFINSCNRKKFPLDCMSKNCVKFHEDRSCSFWDFLTTNIENILSRKTHFKFWVISFYCNLHWIVVSWIIAKPAVSAMSNASIDESWDSEIMLKLNGFIYLIIYYIWIDNIKNVIT